MSIYVRWAEQALLNHYFRAQRTRLPRIWNMNLMMELSHKATWAALLPDARIIHYTILKPSTQRMSRNLEAAAYPADDWDTAVVWPLGFWRAYDRMQVDYGFELPPL